MQNLLPYTCEFISLHTIYKSRNSNTIIFVFQSIVFNPPIFHPKVDPVTGHMETKTSFGKWQLGVRSLNFCAAVNNLYHV